jgi:hypothetical protein
VTGKLFLAKQDQERKENFNILADFDIAQFEVILPAVTAG